MVTSPATADRPMSFLDGVHQTYRKAVSIVLTTLLVLGWLPAIAQSINVGYESATYHGRKFGIGINLKVQIGLRNYDSTAPQWMQLPEDGHARSPFPEQPWVHITLQRRVFGRSTTTDTLLDPRNGSAIQRIVQRKDGNRFRYKATQYGPSGVRVLRTTSATDPIEVDWQQASSTYQSYPSGFTDGLAVSDASVLFYLLNRTDLRNPGDSLQIPILGNERLILLELTVVELTTSKTNYIERVATVQAPADETATETIDPTTERKVKERRPAILINVDAKQLDSDSQATDVVVLGMEGDLKILLDAVHRMPLRISGRTPRFGKVHLRLKKVDLKVLATQESG